jgi:hypothetical protein
MARFNLPLFFVSLALATARLGAHAVYRPGTHAVYRSCADEAFD